MIVEAKETYAVSVRVIARQMGLSYDTLMRWKRRLSAGLPAIEKPGPKKVAPLNLAELKQKIGALDHGRKRSRGTGRLHGEYAGAVSRREFDRLVRWARSEKNRERRGEQCRILWLRPNLAWAMDDCQKHLVDSADSLHMHNLGDLCSRYRFRPLAGDSLACGEEVAGHLKHLFNRFGPPLFCKRDNGGNLNHSAVDDALSEAMVVPINNPVYTASYNGAIEHTQGEFKSYLHRWEWKSTSISEAILLVETAAHDLNHKGRRSLGGKTACRAYFNDNRLRFTKRRRNDIYRWIRDLAMDISLAAGNQVITAWAWRAAAKKWLVKNGMVRILRAGIVLPDFPPKLCHN